MTIATAVTPRITYAGTGAQTSFAYPWLVLEAADLAVYQNGLRKTLGVHYTVSLIGTPGGGNVVFTLAPAAGDALVFVRETQVTQGTTLADTGPAAMSAIERMADRLTMIAQELLTRLARTPLLNIFSSTQNPTLADPSALWLLRWKSDLTGIESVDPTTVLPGSATLPLAVTQGGTNATSAAGARITLGLDGQVRKTLTNQTGVTLAAGDVVGFDPATDNALILADTSASKMQGVVVLETIAPAAGGACLLSGIGPVNVSGVVTRGHYLRKSATTRMAEDTGVAQSTVADPPQGAFGVALTGGSGQVTARLFGFTYPGVTAPVITGWSRVIGAAGVNNGGALTTQFDLAATAAVLRDPTGGGTLVLPAVATRTADIAVAGPTAGGRDQAGAFSANSWLYRYLIGKTDGTYALTWSLTPPPTGPALPTGYTLWAYAGAHRLDNSSQLLRLRLRGGTTRYEAQQTVLSAGSAVIATAISVATVVPPTADVYDVRGTTLLITDGSGVGQVTVPLRVTPSLDEASPTAVWNATASALQQFTWGAFTLPNASQAFQFLNVIAFGSGAQTTMYVGGYTESL